MIAPFRVGDLVMLPGSDVVRTVVAVVRDRTLPSGLALSLDGGSPCHACGRGVAPVFHIDSAHVQPVTVLARSRVDALAAGR
jgi:hypothetical protein